MAEIKFSEKDLEKFRKLGLIDEIRLRDLHLKREYRRRIKQNPMKKKGFKGEIKEELGKEYNLSPDTLNQILFFIDVHKKKQPIVKELK